MDETIFKGIYFLGWAVYMFGIYTPHARRFRRATVIREHTRPRDALLDFTVFLTWQVLPLVYVFSSWLAFADYPRTPWLGWFGAGLLAAALALLFPAYRTLGANWSPKIDVREGQGLVTTGMYRRIRHPIYAGMWLWAAANAMLLANWVAGPGFLVTFPVLYFTRTPREEAMMEQHFGEAYRAYMRRTGRLVPKPGSRPERG